MTPVFCCGFECGQSGNVGQHWNNTVNAISTTIVRNGSRSLRSNPSAQATTSVCGVAPSGTGLALRLYVYFTTLPNASIYIVKINTADGNFGGVYFNITDSKLYARAGSTNGGSGITVTTGTWYRIDLRGICSSNPHSYDVRVDGAILGQSTNAVAASTFNALSILDSNSSTWSGDAYADDVIYSLTFSDYPIGAGSVQHFIPTSDGTHTATTTTIVKGTIAAPTGGGNVAGATDVFNWVNGVPLLGGATDNTRLVNQQSNGTTLYAEVILGPAPGISTPTTAPRAVEVITADRQASTTTGDFTTKLNDNGTENTIIARGVVAGSTTDRFARKHYALAPTGGAWTVVSGAGNFNNLRARFGYASDANPDQYWRGIMVEAEFIEGTIVSAGLGAFTATGLAPTITATQNQTVLSNLGVLTATGLSTTIAVTDHKIVSTGVGVITGAGFSPSIIINTIIQANTGQGLLTGLVPTIATSNNTVITTNVGSSLLTGILSSIAITNNQTAASSLGQLTGAGFAPKLNSSINTGLASLISTGISPVIAVSNNIQVSTGIGASLLTGIQPQILTPKTVNPALGQLSATGIAPTITVGANRIVLPDFGLLSLTSFIPVVIATNHITAIPQTGDALFNGFSPIIVAADNKIVSPLLGDCIVTGFSSLINIDTVTSSGGLLVEGYDPALWIETGISPLTGALISTGFEPTVNAINERLIKLLMNCIAGNDMTYTIEILNQSSVKPGIKKQLSSRSKVKNSINISTPIKTKL